MITPKTIRFFITKIYSLKEKIVQANRVFPFLCRSSHIRLYYVNVVSLVSVGYVVSFSKQHDRSGAVREKEIKNCIGDTNVVSAKQRFANSSSGMYPELYIRLVEIAALVGWILFLSRI